jgi:hypothetical protein
VFVVPGFAKFVVIKKPATKARKGTNPFTGEPTTFKASPHAISAHCRTYEHLGETFHVPCHFNLTNL